MRRRSKAGGEPAKAQRRKTGVRKGRIASKAADPISSSGSDGQSKVARLARERDEALEQQRATADVLKVVSRSGFDLQLVLETLVESAAKLCEADFADIWRPYGPSYRVAATYQTLAAHKEYLTNLQIKPSRGSCVGRTLLDAKIVHIHDIREDAEYAMDLKKLGERRTMLGLPLLRDGKPIGVIALTRSRVRPFTSRQIDLVTTFADQAVIAIENTRLLNELRESLQQQTATADVLKVISRSTVDLKTVLDTLVQSAARLCAADKGTIQLQEGGVYRIHAHYGLDSEAVEYAQLQPLRPGRGSAAGRVALYGKTIQIPDVLADPEYHATDYQQAFGYRTILGVPLLRDGKTVGTFSLLRDEVSPFTDKQIELVRTFADQAVIALENNRLLGELRERTGDLEESLKYQTATSDVLKVISRSSLDLQRVLDTLIQTAAELCETGTAAVAIRQDDVYRYVATARCSSEYDRALRTRSLVPGRDSIVSRVLLERKVVHIIDAEIEPGYDFPDAVNIGRVRTLLGVPMFREDEVVGVIGLSRQHVEPFTERQIELMRTFADQAVIAIENARLLGELRETLERQTATSEVLQVINASPGDLTPVFEAMLDKALALCGALHGIFWSFHGDQMRVEAARGQVSATTEYFAVGRSYSIGAANAPARLIRGERFVHILDVAQDYAYEAGDEIRRVTVEIGCRTLLAVPLRKEGTCIGAFIIDRTEVRPFTERQIALLENFAAQAVIAMENARLLGELRERTTDLARSVDELTATGDVLKIISRSSVDLETVLNTLVETVARLCRADHTVMLRRRDDLYHLFASHGISAEARNFFLAHPFAPSRETITGRTALERRAIHIEDVLHDPEYTCRSPAFTGARSSLGIPLLRGDTLTGVFVAARTQVDPFTAKEIELATTFADQAVIAIENARLFDELRERQAELRVTFDNMGDGVVMFDAQARLTSWNRNFQDILDLPDAFLAKRPSYADYFRYLAGRGEYAADLEAELSRTLEDNSREMRFERTRPDGRIIEVRRNPVPDGGFVLIYADITERKRAEEAVRLARDAAETALRELQAAQNRLVQTQKLASLGQLTAGIAHEIKNPLNFVNNFSALSVELADELSDVLKPVALPGKVREEVKELTGTLKDNLGRVVQHGKRADSIVKNMLMHSREGSGERRTADINALVGESLNLAYHGARAEKTGFAITLRHDLDPEAGAIDLYPQEITRALLNLISNGFYAANRRKVEAGDDTFEPVLTAATRNLGPTVEIRIRDNGSGIPPEVQEKMFNPFFTTKPTGEGTGLGLSMTHDIIVKQHGGRIDVRTEPGVFTEIVITLPRDNGTAAGWKPE
jgi:PAS domain S-box-containing protein